MNKFVKLLVCIMILTSIFPISSHSLLEVNAQNSSVEQDEQSIFSEAEYNEISSMYGELFITTFEDLKYLISTNDGKRKAVNYDLNEELVIEESIEIPDNFVLEVSSARVPEGVILTTSTMTSFRNLIVEGTYNSSHTYIWQHIAVTGTINNYDYFSVSLDAEAEGLYDCIHHCTPDAVLTQQFSFTTLDEVRNLCDEVKDFEQFSAVVELVSESEKQLVINHHFSIPATVYLSVGGYEKMVIEKGISFRVNGNFTAIY